MAPAALNRAATSSGTATAPAATAPAVTPLIASKLNPIDLKLLGLEVQTSQIQVNISAQPGTGQLLGNLLTDVNTLLNVGTVNNALNNVLASVVTLVNSIDLNVAGAKTYGALGHSLSTATTPVLDLFVAPVHLNLLGALVDTSPIHLTITAHSGKGLILGNLVADLAHLLDPPLPSFSVDAIDLRLQQLLKLLTAQVPGIPTATTTTAPAKNTSRILSLDLAPIDVNLLGLVLKTSEIQVNADAHTGNGLLLGNLLTSLLNTAGATPTNLHDLSKNLTPCWARSSAS